MLIYPAIDLFNGEAVRLYKGDYAQKTVYSKDPLAVAYDFKKCGAERIHIVDLEGAKNGDTPNYDIIVKIRKEVGLFCECGGGIRDMETAERYLSAGIDRVILGTAAVSDPGFVEKAVARHGERIAVGIDVLDGMVAVKGWTEKSAETLDSFCGKMETAGVKTIIVTDISKDGAMAGTNRGMYEALVKKYGIDIIASGGVSSLDDIKALKSLGIHGAIVGKAYYTKAFDLAEAIEVAK